MQAVHFPSQHEIFKVQFILVGPHHGYCLQYYFVNSPVYYFHFHLQLVSPSPVLLPVPQQPKIGAKPTVRVEALVKLLYPTCSVNATSKSLLHTFTLFSCGQTFASLLIRSLMQDFRYCIGYLLSTLSLLVWNFLSPLKFSLSSLFGLFPFTIF